jgi:hypothetical protein
MGEHQTRGYERIDGAGDCTGQGQREKFIHPAMSFLS